jgi:hypothetical protein
MADGTNDGAKPEKLTLWEALKDLGWFSFWFAVIVGGPSVLAILEEVFVNHQLVPALQWIVDGYQRIMGVLGAIVEPLVQPAIEWINARFGWNLMLDPVWRPVFALCMVFLMAFVRKYIRNGDVARAVGVGGVVAIGFLTAALLIGLFAAGPGWLAQGAVAAVLIATFGVVGAARNAAGGDWRKVGSAVGNLGEPVLFLFAIGAGLSFVPGLAQSGGLIVLGGMIALLGVVWVGSGLSGGDRSDTRVGLTTLGGFVAAGLILAADFALKALGAG